MTRSGHRRRRWTAATLGALALATPVAGQATRAERVETLLRAYHDVGRFNGAALVVDGGETLYEGAFGFARRAEDATTAEGGTAAGEVPNEIDTPFRIASLPEQFTAALVLRLVERADLALDAPVRAYLPEYPTPQGDRVTIHHLLTHTSGIPSYTEVPGFMEERADEPLGPPEIVALTGSEPLRFEPGSRFEYDDTGYVLLAWIVERVTGRPYEEVLRELVLDPVGLEHTGYDHDRVPGAGRARGYARTLDGYEAAPVIGPSLPFPAGMPYSTVEDLGRWAEALSRFEPGRPFERPETLGRLLTPFLDGYAYGIAVGERSIGREDGVRVLEHGGGIFGFSSALRVFPDQRRVIVLLDNTASALGAIADGLTNLLWGAEAPMPKPSIAERLLPIVETGGVDAALERYRTWRRTRPDGYDYGPGELARLASHVRERGRPEDAIRILETATELYPDSTGPRLALSELEAARGDTAGAVSQLEAALSWHPGEPRLLQPLLELRIEPAAALRLPVVELVPEAMERLTGRYRIDPTTSLDIRHEDGGLVAQRTGEDAFPLLPQGETTFLLEGSPIQLVFRLEDGRAAAVSILESGQRVTFERIPAPD